jgi:adenylosuccinate lyase
MSDHDRYENPLISRYASEEMARLWGDQRKFSTWRRLWVALAEAEQELGLPISNQQLTDMRAHLDDVDFDAAARHEKRLRHDVMAHVTTFGECAPSAKPIIHLGATSCYVTDNTDLILMREGLQLVARRLAGVIDALGAFAAKHRDLACLAFTHLQPAQPTTVGKRACLWAYDLALDLTEIEHRISQLKARSVKGTTGTQASFLELFNGDHAKVRELERRVAAKLGFEETYAVTGQTYSRKVDAQVIDALSGVGQSAHKAATDLRLLISRKEIDEPYVKDQIGSSAMAYKRNPMRCERICALSRFVMSLPASAAQTMATQWMERTLDDSANRRLTIPQAFLAVDAVLLIYQTIASGMHVYPQVVGRNLLDELPYMATENIMMAAVKAGGDRQELHEQIRVHSLAAADYVKATGEKTDVLARISADPAFQGVNLAAALDPQHYVGRAPQQVDEFLTEVVAPIRSRYASDTAKPADLRV